MKKILLFTLIVLHLFFSCKKENLLPKCECTEIDSKIVWQKTLGGNKYDECGFGKSAIITSDDNILMGMVVGADANGLNQRKLATTEINLINQQGGIIWTRQLGIGLPKAVGEINNGYFIVVEEYEETTQEENQVVYFLNKQGNLISTSHTQNNSSSSWTATLSKDGSKIYKVYDFENSSQDSTLILTSETFGGVVTKTVYLPSTGSNSTKFFINSPVDIRSFQDGSILIISTFNIYKLDQNMNLIYSYGSDDWIYLTHIYDESFLYFEHNSNISKFNISSGQIFWKRQINKPVDAGNRAYSLGVYDNGDIQFVYSSDTTSIGNPNSTNVGKGVYVYNNNGNFLRKIELGGCNNKFTPVIGKILNNQNIILIGDITGNDCDIEDFYGGRDVWVTKINH